MGLILLRHGLKQDSRQSHVDLNTVLEKEAGQPVKYGFIFFF